MNKRGQFFIFAAIIIVTIIVGLMGISNYAKVNDEPRGFYDLTKELGQETNQVINYDSISGDPGKVEDFTNQVLENLIDRDPGREIIVIYGNSMQMTVTNCAKETVEIFSGGVSQGNVPGCLEVKETCVTFSGVKTCTYPTIFEVDQINPVKSYKKVITTPSNKIIDLKFPDGKIYEFKISAGQNFFSVLKKNLKEEEYVDTSK